MLYIFSEPLFIDSPWYKIIYKSLCDELGRKKSEYIDLSNDCNEFSNYKNNYAYLIGTNKNWLNNKIDLCMRNNIHPIVLSTQQDITLCGVYSSVTSNINSSMRSILAYLSDMGNSEPALFGVNRLSLTNMSLLNQFEKIAGNSDDSVYFNEGSINKCADEIIRDLDKYDSIISVNDFATILLIKKLSKIGKYIPVISYGATKLAKRLYPDLRTISMGYESFGKAAVSISDVLKKDNNIESLTYTVKCKFENMEIDPNIYISDFDYHDKGYDKLFYSDNEINDMIQLENMLIQCDLTDTSIIDMLLQGDSYETIAEKTFCALNTVKYRVKKMRENCGCEKKKDMINLIKLYSIENY